MTVITSRISIDSSEKTELIDITRQLYEIVRKSRIKEGIATVFTNHTTTAIFVNENEQGLVHDMKQFLEKLAPQFRRYEHDEMEKRPGIPTDEPANAHSHLKSMLIGASETIPVIDGEPELGTWQKVFLAELDGPRSRKVIVQILGER